MISATLEAAAKVNGYHATATTTTGGIVLPPLSSVSTRRVSAATSQLVPSMLSELSFSHEVPRPDLIKLMSRNKGRRADREKPSKYSDEGNDDESSKSLQWSWDGLLIFSSGDRDLFFDAQEMLPLFAEEGMDVDGKVIVTETSVSSSERSEASAEPFESVEMKPDEGNSVVTTVCEIRGGQRHEQNLYPLSSTQYKAAAFGDPPSRIPGGKRNPNQSGPNASHVQFIRPHAPPAPKELPIRFLRAGKGDPIEGQRRYEATLKWRKENCIDTILFEPYPLFEMVKKHYPHYFHLRGRRGEPVFFEQPPKTDLVALKAGGMNLQQLVRHYVMITEFQWQFIEPHDLARSITVLDLEGMRMIDFVGECVEYVKMCSQFTGQHYPERAGHVIVVNVPRWFAMIWKVVKPMVDEVTLKKISIVRGKDAVFAALAEKIPVENIPPEYGGKSVPLGESPEENALRDLMWYNNALASGDNPPSMFCSWGPVRSY